MNILRKQQHELEAELEHQRERLHMQAAQEEQDKGLAHQQVPAQGASRGPAGSCHPATLCSWQRDQPVPPVTLWAS